MNRIRDKFYRFLVISSLISFATSITFHTQARFFSSEGWNDLGEFVLGVIVSVYTVIAFVIGLIYFLVGLVFRARKQKGDGLAVIMLISFPLLTLLYMVVIYTQY